MYSIIYIFIDTQFMCVIMHKDVQVSGSAPVLRALHGLRAYVPYIIIRYSTNFYLNMHALYI